MRTVLMASKDSRDNNYKEDHPEHPLHNFYLQLRVLEDRLARHQRKRACASASRSPRRRQRRRQ